MVKQLILLCTLVLPLAATPIMSYENYASVKRTFPHIFYVQKGSAKLYYFGADHSWDPKHPQYQTLENVWQEFLEKTKGQKLVALVEGQIRELHNSSTIQQAIRRGGGEGGALTFLAQQNDIAVECPKPTKEWLHAELLKEFSPDIIAYKIAAQSALCALRSYKENTTQTVTEYCKEYIENCLAQQQALFDFPLTFERIEKIHATLFTTPLDVKDEEFFYTITNPVETKTVINRACRAASRRRDEHIVAYIQKKLEQNTNVFIVYGFTHAIMQEPAFISL